MTEVPAPQDPLHVLFLRPRIEPGGAGLYMLELARALEAHGHWVGAAASGGGWQARFPRFYPAPLHPSTPYHLLAGAVRIARLVRQHGINVLHSHHRFTTLAGRLASRWTGVPLVGTVHELKSNWRPLARLWLAPWVCVPSAELGDFVRPHLAPGRLLVIPPGLETRLPAPERVAQLRQTLGGWLAGPVIGYLGRLAPEKGVDTLIQAFARVSAARPRARLLIVGDGDMRSELEQLSARQGLQAGVHFAGWQEDPVNWLALMDVVALPSRTEGLPLTAVQAMQAAKPVAASAVGGLPELVEPGVTGWLVPPDEPPALAAALLEALAQPDRARACGEAGRRRALAWTPERMAGQVEALYRRALQA